LVYSGEQKMRSKIFNAPLYLVLGLSLSIGFSNAFAAEDTRSVDSGAGRVLLFGGCSQSHSRDTLNAGLSLLNQRDTVIIVDRSLSMKQKDCPRADFYSNKKISRWQWCQQQMSNLASRAARFYNDKVRLVLFSDSAKTYDNTHLDSIPSVMKSFHPYGGTQTAQVLHKELSNYFARRHASPESVKPLVIVVITDGKPSNMTALKETLIDATHRMRYADEIAITYLTIGNEENSVAVASELDNDLIAQGALYDIVETRDFNYVQTSGIASVLQDTLISQSASKHM
jgi:hypothetical protein